MHTVATFRREYRPVAALLAAIAVLATLAAAFEGAGMVMVVAMLDTLLESSDGGPPAIGPVEIALSTRALAGAGTAAIVIGAALQIVGARLRGRAIGAWHHRTRLELLDAHANSWATAPDAEDSARIVELANGHATEGAHGVRHLSFAIRGLAGVLVFVLGAVAVDPLGTVLVLVVGVALFGAVRPLVNRSRDAARELSTMNVRVAEALATQIRMTDELRAHGVVEPSEAHFRSLARRHHDVRVRAVVLLGAAPVVFRAAGMLVLVGAVSIGMSTASAPVVRIGLVAILLYRGLSYGQVFQSAWQQAVAATPYLERLRRGLDDLHRQRRPDGIAELDSITRLEFLGVSFAHDDAAHALFSGVDLRVSAGEVIAVMGPSGAGKSTFADLVLGLRAPTAGAVTIEGVDAHTLAPTTRARLVGRVGQDVRVLPGTVADNVRFFRPHVTDEAIVTALERVGLGSLLREADGITTRIGPGGRDLSGGQRQRLGIARALAGDAALVVLDEPTSALDGHNEALVADAIDALRGRAIVIVVAHRPDTIAVADRVIHVEDGRVREVDRVDLTGAVAGVVRPA